MMVFFPVFMNLKQFSNDKTTKKQTGDDEIIAKLFEA